MSPGAGRRPRRVSTYVLIPGAGGMPFYWHRVAPLLEAAGHAVAVVDLPGPDPEAGLPEYTDLVVAAAGDADDVILVGQSMGAFPAVAACERLPVVQLVLLNAMIPAPGETPGEWFEGTDSASARVAAAHAGGYPVEFDLETYFLHDVPPEVAEAGAEEDRPEADVAFGQPCAVAAWPDVPTVVLAGEHDRMFPLAFQRRLARERLGLEPVVVPGGHLNALSEPEAVAAALLAAADQVYSPSSRSAYAS
jgi:pimeloyl-ACP methyl ester carboxylesterase